LGEYTVLIYRGAGFCVPFVLLGVFAGAAGVQEAVTGSSEPSRWLTGLNLIIGGVIVYWWGRDLNRPLDLEAEKLRLAAGVWGDKGSGARHSLYGLRMEDWGILCLAVGALVLTVGLVHGS
jgi:hypothetical protein